MPIYLKPFFFIFEFYRVFSWLCKIIFRVKFVVFFDDVPFTLERRSQMNIASVFLLSNVQLRFIFFKATYVFFSFFKTFLLFTNMILYICRRRHFWFVQKFFRSRTEVTVVRSAGNLLKVETNVQDRSSLFGMFIEVCESFDIIPFLRTVAIGLLLLNCYLILICSIIVEIYAEMWRWSSFKI